MSSTDTQPASPALVIDGSSACFFAGALGSNSKWLACQKATEPALESLFKSVEQVLAEAKLELDQIQSYIYCEGPGSVLGLRLCSMAIETWRQLQSNKPKVFAYNSLKLTAATLLHQQEISGEVLLVSDWKKDIWNGIKIHQGKHDERVSPVSSEELMQWPGPIYHLPARKGWQKPPEGAIEVNYEPEQLPHLQGHPGLIQETDGVDLYQSGINTFQKWTPERHRAIST